jgi:cytochrome c-type biogenesis protein CcmH
VRYRPSFSGPTIALWLAPLLLLLAGVTVALLTLRGRRKASASLSTDDEQRLRDLLDKSERDA